MKAFHACLILVLSLVSMLSGCAYYCSQTAVIKYCGNINTSREAVENDVLYEAAKITASRGFTYFVIGPTDTYPTYHPCITYPRKYGCYNVDGPEKTSAVVIRMFSGWKPECLPNAYYACEILGFNKMNASWNSNIHQRN